MKSNTHRILASLAVGALLALLSQPAHTLAIADSTISAISIEITPSSGTAQFLLPWEAEAYAEARNSLGELDSVFDTSSGGLAEAAAAVTWASGYGAADALAMN